MIDKWNTDELFNAGGKLTVAGLSLYFLRYVLKSVQKSDWVSGISHREELALKDALIQNYEQQLERLREDYERSREETEKWRLAAFQSARQASDIVRAVDPKATPLPPLIGGEI